MPLDELSSPTTTYWEEGAPYDLFKRLRGGVPGPLDGGIYQLSGRGGLLVGDDRR